MAAVSLFTPPTWPPWRHVNTLYWYNGQFSNCVRTKKQSRGHGWENKFAFFFVCSQIHKKFMKRKQRKSLLWRRFGYVILIIIKFGELLLWISPRIINVFRSYMKHSKECFIRYQNTSKLVKKNSGCASFFNPLLSVLTSDETLFLVFDILLQRK